MAENMEINKAKDGCYAIEKEAEYLEGVIPWYKYSGVDYKSEVERYESMHEDIERCGEKYDRLNRKIISMFGVGVLVAIGLCPILILQ